jgi:hypothetical protein
MAKHFVGAGLPPFDKTTFNVLTSVSRAEYGIADF